MRTLSSLLALALALLAAPASQAAESYANCTGYLNSLPAVIATQGTWCMNKDLATSINSGSAVTITTNNVILDCNDYKLGGLSAGTGTGALGISTTNRLNITVRNCNVRGFAVGIALDGSTGGGHLVERNRADGNTLVGIRVEGTGSTVRGNLVNDSGGSTSGSGSDAIGIHALQAVDVIDNTVTGVSTNCDGCVIFGIAVQAGDGSTVAGNRIRGMVGGASNNIYGVYGYSSSRVTYRDNHFVNLGVGTATGVYCGSATAVALGNVISGFTTAIENCVDGGNTIL